MYVRFGLSVLLGVLLSSSSFAFEDPVFRAPAGWQQGVENGLIMLAPSNMTEEEAVVVVIYPVASLGGAAFSTWFEKQMASSLVEGATVISKGQHVSNRGAGLETLTTASAVQDAGGAIRLLMFHAVTDGSKAAFAMGVTASEKAVNKYSTAIREVFENLNLPGRTQPAPTGASQAPAGSGPASSGWGMPEADVVDGRPRGVFGAVSYAELLFKDTLWTLVFFDDGKVAGHVPYQAGAQTLTWEKVVADRSDRGEWQINGGKLRVKWYQHGGSATEYVEDKEFRPDPLGFWWGDKLYRRAVPLQVSDCTGQWHWESTRHSMGVSLASTDDIEIGANGYGRWSKAKIGATEGVSQLQEGGDEGLFTFDGLDVLFQTRNGLLRESFYRLAGEDRYVVVGGGLYARAGGSPPPWIQHAEVRYTSPGGRGGSPPASPSTTPPASPPPAPAGTPPAARQEFSAFRYSTPAGWVAAEQEGNLLLAPEDATEETVAIAVVFPVQSLPGTGFRAWLDTMKAQLLAEGAKVISDGEVETLKQGGVERLTTARAVQDAEGGVRIQMFHALSDGRSVGLAMAVAASEKALEKHLNSIRGLFDGLEFREGNSSSTGPGSGTAPVAGGSSTGGVQVPVSRVLNGRPQGLFVGVSMLSGNAVFLLFLEDGKVLHNMPRGGMNRLDWQDTMVQYPDQTGTWSENGGVLTIQWVDGNVWSGPLEITPTGFRYEGKSYGAAQQVSLSQIVGGWEGTSSTAWMNAGSSGPVTTSVNDLSIDHQGRFRMDATMGSDVGTAVGSSSSSWGGTVRVEGYDLVLQGEDGRVLRASIVALSGGDVLLIDGRTYTRR